MANRKLKNWIVTSESVKGGRDGLVKYFNYLRSQSDHKGQEIKMLSDYKALALLMDKPDRFNLARRLKKGGRPSNYGWSSVFTYPFRVDSEKFSKVFDFIINGFIDFLEQELRKDATIDDHFKFLENSRKNIRSQMIMFEHRGENINNHWHCIFPTHYAVKTKDGQSIIKSVDLTKKRFTHKLKELNNEAISTFLGKSNEDYIIESANAVAKKRVNKERYKALQAQKSNKDLSELEETQKRLNELYIDYIDYCNFKGVENIPEWDKNFLTLNKYIALGRTNNANKLMDKMNGLKIYVEETRSNNSSSVKPQK